MQVISQAKTLASNYSPYLIIFIVILIIGAIAGIIYAIVYAAQKHSVLANPSNIQRIIDLQNIIIKSQYNIYTSNLQEASKLWSGVPQNQRLLINANMIGVRLAGYLGPFVDGVFSEDSAVSTALMTGARVIFIDIDVDSVTNKPTLVYRDANGFIKSLNNGSIKNVAKAINDRGFSSYSSSVPIDVRGLPMIVVLYFHKTPDIVQQPNEYIKFLIQVSKELQAIQPNLLAQTAQGDFRRQNMDTQLFFQPMKTYRNKIILLCNVDTSILRNAASYGIYDLGPGGDLDLLVHARLYSQQSGTSFGSTSMVSGTKPPAAILTQPDYFINMPPEKRSDSILLTKKCFTITMNSDPSIVTTKPMLDSLIANYGVNCVPLVHFMDMKDLAPYFAIGNLYEKSSVLAKSQQLRFVPPEPIVTQVPNSNMNTQGGFIRLSNV
jgi:hypothetical protein